jgi:hypothetical protein
MPMGNIVALPFFLTEAIFLLYVADCHTDFVNDLMTLVHHKHVLINEDKFMFTVNFNLIQSVMN